MQLSWEHLQREKSSKVTAVFFWTLTAFRTTSRTKVTEHLKLQLTRYLVNPIRIKLSSSKMKLFKVISTTGKIFVATFSAEKI